MSAGLLLTEVTAERRAHELAASFSGTAAEHDRTGAFPFENFRLLHEAGLLALRTPKRCGGVGAGIAEAARVIGAIAQGDAATALVLAMQYIQHAGISRSTRWPELLKERIARETVAGISLINALRVEADLGSPARGGLPGTIASLRSDGWHLSGRKIYSTGAPILAWYAVWARTDEAEPCVGTFLVPTGQPGTRIEETWDHLGLRASGSHDVVFEDVLVPLDHAVDVRPPAEWTPADTLQQHVENGILLAALYDGVARAAFAWLVAFLETRTPTSLGRPLATLPRVQDIVGGIAMKLRVNQRLIDGLSGEIDAGVATPATDAHVVKSVVTNNAVEAIEAALSLTGNHGLTRANPLQRHYRDALCGRVHTPQDDATRAMLGRLALD